MQLRLGLIMIATLALVACGDDSASSDATEEVRAAATASNYKGFVFSQWGYDIPHDDPGECPEGFNVGEDEFLSEEYQKVDAEFKKRYEAGDTKGAISLLPPDACKDPGLQPDPGHILFAGNAAVQGIDLDGVNSRADADGQCPHNDFAGGIDNQHYRLMGCVKGYRPDGLFDRLFDERSSILENGYSTLLELRLTEGDLRNGKFEAQLFTSAGPVSKDANGKVIRDMSQQVHKDPMYHSDVFTGEIVDGKLSAGPVDAKLRFKVQAIDNHYYFRDLRISADVLPDGSLKGVLAGYWDIANMWNFLTEVYIGPVHLGRAAANNIGYMCAGVYHAMPRVADGHPDPETGQCTSISTVIDFEAVSAFVIKPEQVAMQR